MGQAKLKGTKEERIKQGIEKARIKESEDRRARHLALVEAELKLTPEQRAGRNKARSVLAAAFGLVGGVRGFK